VATRSSLVRLFAVASAGVATFYGAAEWSRAAREPSPDQVVQPAKADVAARPAPSLAIAAAPAPPAGNSGPDGLQPRSALAGDGHAFARLSWLPPPPPPPPPPVTAPVPPPPPTAPALPFTFVGMVERGADKPQAFLSKGDSLLIVAAGDLVDGNTYRVESLSPSQVVLTYLPLDQRQTIDVSGAVK
jgi:hypothetical protein